jgi:hypothetical protein
MKENPSADILKELIEIILFKDEKKDYKTQFLFKLYSIIGLDNFVKVVEELGGMEIALPTAKELRETVQTAMAYYYKHFSGYQWSEEDRKKFEQTGNAKYKVKSRVDKLDKIIEDYIKDIQIKYQEPAN